MRLSAAADVLNAKHLGADVSFSSVSTDTRQLAPGDLYVALSGPNFDGHAFVGAAAAGGAVAAVVSEPVEAELPQLQVGDTLSALGGLARTWRRMHDIPVVAITGSNGKTTVKEMTAAILAQKGVVLATRGNLNNHIGLPLTLLRLDARHQYAVVEMGASGPREIGPLSEMAAPGVAMITNAAPAHLEGFGDLDGVARAKGEIYSGLSADGKAIINADDPYAGYWHDCVPAGREIVTFGMDNPADVSLSGRSATEIRDGRFLTRLTLQCAGGEAAINLHLAGEHNVRNALAAVAAAMACGADTESVSAGLATMEPVAGRLRPRHAEGGATLIDDSYNANPASLEAAIDVLAGLKGRRILVLGDMAELGDAAAALHAGVGDYARSRGIDQLHACGDLAREAVRAFGAGAQFHDSCSALAAALKPTLKPGDIVLVKGSRGQRMERVVEALEVTR